MMQGRGGWGQFPGRGVWREQVGRVREEGSKHVGTPRFSHVLVLNVIPGKGSLQTPQRAGLSSGPKVPCRKTSHSLNVSFPPSPPLASCWKVLRQISLPPEP